MIWKDKVEVRRTGCFGFCSQGPIVVIHPEETFYTHVKLSDVPEIVGTHVVEGKRIDRLLYYDPAQNLHIEKWGDIGFYGKQKRILLRNCGIVDPENIQHYIAREGYEALRQVLAKMTPEQVIDEIKQRRFAWPRRRRI